MTQNSINSLYCRFVTGLTVQVYLQPQHQTVQHLKQLISDKVNLGPDKLYIGYETTMLNDNDYLSHAQITDGDTVHVITSQLTEKIQVKNK